MVRLGSHDCFLKRKWMQIPSLGKFTWLFLHAKNVSVKNSMETASTTSKTAVGTQPTVGISGELS